jgi:hypothetical protein
MSMEYENVYGIVVTWQNLTTWKETCSSVSLSTTNPTWTGHGVKLCRVSRNVLCYIIPCVNIELLLHPLQIHNGCPSLFYQTTPRLQHTRVVCRSPKCSYLSFPNGSALSVTSTSIYKSLFYQDRSPAECQLMGITDTSFAEEHVASNLVTSSPEDGGKMFLQNFCI